MKGYSFGEENAPVILLLPGTCCHWKGNFGHVIPLLSDEYRVLCVSYDGFDETERTEFPTMLEETAKIESCIKANCGGHIRAAYGCSLGGSFVGLLAARGNIRMDYGILGSSVVKICGKIADRASPAAAVPDAPRRQVQVPSSAKENGEADAGEGRLRRGLYADARRQAALLNAAKLQKPVLFRPRHAAAR